MQDDLRLPRILCLHGGGTNTRIFGAQCRVLSSQLRGMFRLVFAQAPFPSNPGPDVVSVYRGLGPFYAWIPPISDSSFSYSQVWEALHRTMEEDDDIGASGPWVGVLGFSQGAAVCSKSLMVQQRQAKHSRFSFRFGVLLAGRTPASALALRQNTSLDGQGSVAKRQGLSFWQSDITTRLRLPTIHVHGLQDDNIDLHRCLLHDWCEPDTTRLLEWNGGHKVPIKSDDVSALVELVLGVAKEAGVNFRSHVQC